MSGAVVLSAGCHHNNYSSGYGVGWVTVSNGSGPFANNVQFSSYVVNVDSITLTDTVGNTYTAVATIEPVDFVKLSNIAELWGSATIPVDTYVMATITLDYTNAAVSLLVNGVPTAAKVAFPGGAALGQVVMNVYFDKSNPWTVGLSYATTNAKRLAMDFDLAASNVVNLSTSPATVTATPFFRISEQPADTKLIRIRGPLVNSNAILGTYSIYERPFYDEVNNVGTLTIFNSANTVYLLDGTTYVGNGGLQALTQVSAGVTETVAITSFEVTPATNNAAGQPTGTAGIFNSLYVVGGGSLETNYTEHLSGDVIARNGNTLTLRNSTLAGATVALTEGYFQYLDADTNVVIGPSTVVSAEGNAQLTNLTYADIAVGQHITAIGTYTLPSTNIITLDAVSPTTGSTAGQVRIESSQLWGTLQTTGTNSLSMNLQYIDNLPVGVFNFAGNGTSSAQDPSPAAFSVNTINGGTVNLSSLVAGTSLWVDGASSPFGSAPPDFQALLNLKNPPAPNQVVSAVNQEAEVPASLQVQWNSTGTTTPFTTMTNSGISIDLTNSALSSAAIFIGPENIALSSLGAPVTIVPNSVTNCVTVTLPSYITAQQPCKTMFAVSTTLTAATSSTAATTGILQYNQFASFITELSSSTGIASATPITNFVANGYFNRATSTFTANSIDVVL